MKTYCAATVSHPPHYLHARRCTNPVKAKVGKHDVCGVHARTARKWEKEGRLDEMVDFWWKEH